MQFHPIPLDAALCSELKDEEDLSIDGSFYGNVGRFINHRCSDANLVVIPVEVETPDHHYYHLAFFTSKKVEPFEELTLDYGIDFETEKLPVKPFDCLCGEPVLPGRKEASSEEEKHISCCCYWGGRLMQCNGCLVGEEGGLIRGLELCIGSSGRNNVGWAVVHFG